MRTIAITINRGGVGKTTLTKHLATAAEAAGYTAMILDMDTQENSTNWHKRRQKIHGKDMPFARFVTENQLPEELARARAAGCDLVFIDTPPGRSSEAPAAVEAAELVLIPFWVDSDAFDGLEKSATLARRLGTRAIAVLNFVTPNSLSQIDTARTVLAAQTHPIPMSSVVLHRYDIYRHSTPAGLTVQEMEPKGRAAAEIGALWNWLCAEMQMSASANVHKGAA